MVRGSLLLAALRFIRVAHCLPYDQAASVKVALGSYVWVEDTDEAWLDGEVVEANDDVVKVKCETKTVSSSLLNK